MLVSILALSVVEKAAIFLYAVCLFLLLGRAAREANTASDIKRASRALEALAKLQKELDSASKEFRALEDELSRKESDTEDARGHGEGKKADGGQARGLPR